MLTFPFDTANQWLGKMIRLHMLGRQIPRLYGDGGAVELYLPQPA